MVEVKNGKLYQDGKEVKPEVGNPEHIEALRKEGVYIIDAPLTEEEEKEVKENGIEIECAIETIARVSFPCICGKEVWEEVEMDSAFSDEDDLDGERLNCRCGKRYEIYEQGTKAKLLP